MIQLDITPELYNKLSALAIAKNTSIEALLEMMVDQAEPNMEISENLQPHINNVNEDSMQQLELAIQTAKLGIWRLNLETNYLYWSDQQLEIYGLTRKEFEEDLDGWRNQVHPDDEDFANAKLAKVFEGETVFDVEFRIIRPNGDIRYINGSAAPILDKDGNVVEVLGINIDISSIKQSESELSTLKKAIDQSTHPLELATIDQGAFYINPAMQRLFAMSADGPALYTTSPTLWVSSTEFDQSMEALRNNGSVSTEMKARRSDGTEFDAFVWRTIIHSGDDQPPLVLSSVMDITERKNAEAKLKEQREILQLSLKAAQAGVWVWDLVNDQVLWDETVEQKFGLQPGEFDGTYEMWKQFIHPDDIARVESQVALSLENEQLYETEFRVYTTNRELRYFLAQAFIVRDIKSNEPLKMVGLNIDITDRKQAEQIAKERTELRFKLAQEQELAELKTDLISLLSHEFKTPLAIISTSSSLLRSYHDKLSEERRQKKLQNIADQVEHLDNMLNEISTLVKAERGYLEYHPAMVNIDKFCKDLLQEMEDTLLAGQTMCHTLDIDIQDAYMDQRLMHHGLSNLISNAVKYSPSGGEIKFAVTQEDHWLHFRVSDNGIGIPEEDQVNLFRRFHRARNVGTINGTGLGLSIVKVVAEQHGGHVSFSSTENEESHFTISIPIRRRE